MCDATRFSHGHSRDYFSGHPAVIYSPCNFGKHPTFCITMLPHISIFVSSNISNSAFSSPIPVVVMASSLPPSTIPVWEPLLLRRSLQHSNIFCTQCRVIHESFFLFLLFPYTNAKPVAIDQLSVLQEPSAANVLPWGPMITLLRDRMTCCYAKFTELDKAIVARKDCALELESPLSTAATTEAMLCSQVITTHTDLASERADITTVLSSAT